MSIHCSLVDVRTSTASLKTKDSKVTLDTARQKTAK